MADPSMNNMYNHLIGKLHRGEQLCPAEMQVLNTLENNRMAHAVFNPMVNSLISPINGGLRFSAPINNVASLAASAPAPPADNTTVETTAKSNQTEEASSEEEKDNENQNDFNESNHNGWVNESLFTTLRLNQSTLYQIPQSNEKVVQALVSYNLDQAEIGRRKRRFNNYIDSLQIESEMRFWMAVGLVMEPLKCYPGGYDGKPGKASEAEKTFNRMVYSSRMNYYEEQVDHGRVDRARVFPKTEKEISDAVRIIHAAAKKNENKKRKSNESRSKSPRGLKK